MNETGFFRARSLVQQYFADRSAAEGVQINPTLYDEKSTVLMGRLYEESTAERCFHIYMRYDPSWPLDAFSKQTGVDFEIALLVLSTSLEEHHFPILWDAYMKWMHQGVDASTVEDMILQQ